jgi:nucleotide-binding universal stress UspA family protein
MKTAERPSRQKETSQPVTCPVSKPVRAANLKVRSILVPTDFSPASNEALKYAADFAVKVGAQITLLHAVEPLPAIDLQYYPMILENEEMMLDCRRELENLPAHEKLDPKLFLRSIVQNGVPFHEITSAAKSLNMDLIIIATHGYTGFKRVLLGSTAERVVRYAPCPVLTVRPVEQQSVGGRRAKAGTKRVAQFRRLLVPVDFSEESKRALQYATRFAEQFGSVVDLIYVIESTGRLKGSQFIRPGLNVGAAATELRGKLAQLAREEVEELAPVFPHVESGKASEEIVGLARSRGADLIVISTHGRTGMKHVLLGNVAEAVLRTAPCPVLVVRKHERDFA